MTRLAEARAFAQNDESMVVLAEDRQRQRKKQVPCENDKQEKQVQRQMPMLRSLYCAAKCAASVEMTKLWRGGGVFMSLEL